ncbi:MlaA family lipoprotein [Plastoroseomonas arctica]|uniref:VacJ family lipoprotein n=1 Tax=Plastoroseomonas arctica TaxID=1509237 RepID=A0AAF1KHT0_9PROT|nr:VacJ family lipoprotein [Plastoroseomonas arctica]MBR0654284.1 VacJ family lipoprotein [Plastoroseomonas arctica]
MRFTHALAVTALLTLGACATRPDPSDPEAVAEYEQNNDPLEPANRVSYAVHDAIDQAVLEPAARGYRYVVPEPVRLSIRNVLANLRTPVVLLNDLLQGDGERARITLGRFMVNSTLGIAGILDVSEDWGVPGHFEDFGQTLAVWGVGEGPFLFVPILGPSNPRDLFGTAVDFAADPLTYFGQGVVVDALNYTRTGLTVVDVREALIATVTPVREGSMDPYATFRSGYRQRRNAAIRNQEPQRGQGQNTGSGVGRGFGLTVPLR